MKILIAILVNLSIFISFTSYAQSSFKNKGKRTSLVNVTKVKYFDIAEKTESIGRLVAVNPTIISSKINQEILKIHYKIGDNVKKNDVLFTLDKKDILRNIDKISAEMKYEKEMLDILTKLPDDVEALERLSELYLLNDEKDKAFDLFKRLAILTPNQGRIHLMLADYYRESGENQKSFQELKLAFKSTKLNIDTKVRILVSYYQLIKIN